MSLDDYLSFILSYNAYSWAMMMMMMHKETFLEKVSIIAFKTFTSAKIS